MTQEPNQRPDPIGDFQRWLFRSGARGMSRELGGNLRSALGLNGARRDVWESATADPEPEAPECAWCPVCRAARMLRESRPGVSAYLTAAGEAVAGLAQEVASAVEAAISAASRPPPKEQAQEDDAGPSKPPEATPGAP